MHSPTASFTFVLLCAVLSFFLSLSPSMCVFPSAMLGPNNNFLQISYSPGINMHAINAASPTRPERVSVAIVASSAASQRNVRSFSAPAAIMRPSAVTTWPSTLKHILPKWKRNFCRWHFKCRHQAYKPNGKRHKRSRRKGGEGKRKIRSS